MSKPATVYPSAWAACIHPLAFKAAAIPSQLDLPSPDRKVGTLLTVQDLGKPTVLTGKPKNIPSLKLTFSHLKMDGSKMKSPFQMAYFEMLC